MSFRVKYKSDPVPLPGVSCERAAEKSSCDKMESPDVESTNTALLLKSFIKENLQGSNDSFGACSIDESLMELEALRLQQGYYYPTPSSSDEKREAVTPEPQPLTRSNVTLHDGIWNLDRIGESNESETKDTPLSLSPPLKNLQIMRPPEQRKPWERGASILDSLSDAESDQSYSSQDTMILKRTEGSAKAQYLDIFEKPKPAPAPVEEAPRVISRLGRKRSLIRQKATHVSEDKQDKSTPQAQASPPRRVHFGKGAVEEEKFVEEVASSSPSHHRNINVDYSRILGKGDEDLDDGYESTDNASSTSSSSNGTTSQAPAVNMVPEEDEGEEGDEADQSTLDSSGNLKTDFGYVNCSRIPSFKRMNLELRKKAGKKGSVNIKDSSIETKLKKLFLSDTVVLVEEEPNDPINNPCEEQQQGDLEFDPRESSGPSCNEGDIQTLKAAESSNYYGSPLTHSPTPDTAGGPSIHGQPHYDTYTGYNQSSTILGSLPPLSIPKNQYESSSDLYTRDTDFPSQTAPEEWDKISNIPEQPKRPAPVLSDRGSPIRTYASYDILPNNSSPTPVHGFFGSQPNLQASRSPQHISQANRYTSQPQLNKNETKSPNWRPLSDLYREDYQQSDRGQSPVPSLAHSQTLPSYHSPTHQRNLHRNLSHSEASVLHNPSVPHYGEEMKGFSSRQDPVTGWGQVPAGSNRSSTSSGVSSNIDSGHMSDPPMRQTVSDENLNTSGSTGSNDSGIEQSTEGSSNMGIVRPLLPSDAGSRRAPVNYTLDDTSRDPMRLVDKVRRRRDASPVGQGTNQNQPLGQTGERAALRAPLLYPAGSFTTPVGKDFSHLRMQSKTMSANGKMQPMKALPMKTSNDGDDSSDNFRETARKMLDSKRLKMRDDYSKYVQLFSRFQKGNSDHSDDSGSDVTSRRSSLPDDKLFGPLDAERQSFNDIKNKLRTQTSMDNARMSGSMPGSPSPSAVRYMSSADIFKMLEEKRGRPRSPRSQSLSQSAERGQRWGYEAEYIDACPQDTLFDRSNRPGTPVGHYSEGWMSPRHQGAAYSKESSIEEDVYGKGKARPGGSTRHARNADIFNLYTTPSSQGYTRSEEVRGEGHQERISSMNV